MSEPEITTTSKGIKLINFNIPHQIIFDDETILKGVNRFQYEVYPEKTTKESPTADLFVLYLHSNIKDIFRELEKLQIEAFGNQRTKTVILVDNKTCELFYAAREKLMLYSNRHDNVCFVASPVHAPNSAEPREGDISDNRRFIHNQFKTFV